MQFYTGSILHGSGIDVGLCTLWTPRHKYTKQLPFVRVIGNLYSHYGIGIIIRNVLAEPSISQIVVTGVDCPESSRRQAENFLTGNVKLDELFLESNHVQEFYRRVTLYDVRHISVRDQAKLTDFLRSISTGKPVSNLPAFVIPIPKVSSETYPTNRAGHLIRANSIEEAHFRVLHAVRTFGMFQKIGPSGYYHQELWQLTVCLASSSSWSNIPLYTNEEIERYGEGLWIGNEPQDVSYDYGHIMRHRYGDQIEAVLNKWKDRRNSLHTVISLWSGDSFEMWAAPCLITIHLRIRDDDILDMYVYFRANEMYKAWPKNIAGLRYLQTRFVEVLNVSLGELTMTSGSAHLFEHDLLHVDSYLKRKPKYPHDWDARVIGIFGRLMNS